jgi:hypothetical protein
MSVDYKSFLKTPLVSQYKSAWIENAIKSTVLSVRSTEQIEIMAKITKLISMLIDVIDDAFTSSDALSKSYPDFLFCRIIESQKYYYFRAINNIKYYCIIQKKYLPYYVMAEIVKVLYDYMITISSDPDYLRFEITTRKCAAIDVIYSAYGNRMQDMCLMFKCIPGPKIKNNVPSPMMNMFSYLISSITSNMQIKSDVNSIAIPSGESQILIPSRYVVYSDWRGYEERMDIKSGEQIKSLYKLITLAKNAINALNAFTVPITQKKLICKIVESTNILQSQDVEIMMSLLRMHAGNVMALGSFTLEHEQTDRIHTFYCIGVMREYDTFIGPDTTSKTKDINKLIVLGRTAIDKSFDTQGRFYLTGDVINVFRIVDLFTADELTEIGMALTIHINANQFQFKIVRKLIISEGYHEYGFKLVLTDVAECKLISTIGIKSPDRAFGVCTSESSLSVFSCKFSCKFSCNDVPTRIVTATPVSTGVPHANFEFHYPAIGGISIKITEAISDPKARYAKIIIASLKEAFKCVSPNTTYVSTNNLSSKTNEDVCFCVIVENYIDFDNYPYIPADKIDEIKWEAIRYCDETVRGFGFVDIIYESMIVDFMKLHKFSYKYIAQDRGQYATQKLVGMMISAVSSMLKN